MSTTSPYVPEYAASSIPRVPRFPGIASVDDGAGAVVWVESHISQGACAADGEPSIAMRDGFAQAIKAGRRNLWGETPELLVAESGVAAASACEGFALAGGRVTSFTGGESLVQMKQALNVIAGKRLPVVFHVAARSLASQGRSRQPGHDDIMKVADAGWGLLFARNAQEAADFALIARRAAEYSETPFLCVQDGFLTTHTMQAFRAPEPEMMRLYCGAPSEHLRSVFNPLRPMMSGTAQGPDSYMISRTAQRFFYDRVKPAIESAMEEFAKLTGRQYGLVNGYRMEDAQYAFVGMGSMMETCAATVDYLRSQGVRVGAVTVSSFRPFPAVELASALANCRAVTVFERTDVPLGGSNPLTVEVKAALADAVLGRTGTSFEWIPEVFAGIAGMGGSDVRPAHFVAASENMRRQGPRFFVMGVNHPDALSAGEDPPVEAAGAFSIRLEEPGAAGRVEKGRKVARTLAGVFGLYLQASDMFEAEKRGLPASFDLALSPEPLRTRTIVGQADLLIGTGASVDGLKRGGLLCVHPPRPWEAFPSHIRRAVRERNLTVWTVDGEPLAAALRLAPWRKRNGLTEEQMFEQLAKFVQPEELAGVRQAYGGMAQVGIPPAEVPREQPIEPAWESSTDFRSRVVGAFCSGEAGSLEADAFAARGLVPASTALDRSFRDIATELPKFSPAACVGCMECVNQCPDTAITARVVEPAELETRLNAVERADYREELRRSFTTAKKYEGGLFGLFIDVDKCKGCGECVTACGNYKALAMAPKADLDVAGYDRALELYRDLPDTPEKFLNTKSLGDMMLTSRSQLYTGGGASCTGCGESTVLRLLLGATGFQYGADKIGVVAAMGCNFCSAYPYNPAAVPWTNSLLDNAPADAMGIRMRWDQQEQKARRLWVVGGDEALVDAGFQYLSRLLASGMDIKVLVLDTHAGEQGHRDVARIAMMHPEVFVAQTTAGHLNHFYKCVMDANAYAGPAVVVCYSSCIKEHELAADRAVMQARLAVESRAFPLMIYDPAKGDAIRERLSLKGNPGLQQDWYERPKAKQPIDFAAWASTEPRFAAYFDADGRPGPIIERIQRERLVNWRHLQEMAGLR